MNSKKEYLCQDCGKKFIKHQQCIANRHYHAGEPICNECYRKISKGGRYLDDHPLELDAIWKQDVFDYEVIKPFLGKLKTKKKVKFICQECGKYDIMSINTMRHRKICGCKPICRKCSLKYAVNSEEWRSSNSKAQYIAQNRPAVLEKQRLAQYRLMRNDPLYAEKRCCKTFISGKIKGIRFDSSWELYYIVYCWNSKDVVSIDRFDGYIKYTGEDGKKRKYNPDFIVTYKNKNKKVIEIKGCRKYNHFYEKFNAARKKYGANYLVIEEKDLLEIGIRFRDEKFLMNFYRKNWKSIVFYNNEKTKSLKKRIRKWLK